MSGYQYLLIDANDARGREVFGVIRERAERCGRWGAHVVLECDIIETHAVYESTSIELLKREALRECERRRYVGPPLLTCRN